MNGVWVLAAVIGSLVGGATGVILGFVAVRVLSLDGHRVRSRDS